MSFGVFGNIVHKFQSLSPLASPTTSPVNSPKPTRRKLKLKDKSRKRRLKEEYREVQSDPELDYDAPRKWESSFHKKLSGANTHVGGLDKINKDVRTLGKSTGSLTTFGLSTGSRTLGRTNGFREAQRLVQYERFLRDIIRETNPVLEQSADESSHQQQRKEIPRRGESSSFVSDLTRIQDLFLLDDLQLDQKDAFNAMSKMKGLMRKRSTTAARLQRAFSTKALRAPNDERSENDSPPSIRNKSQQPKRTFLLEAPVQFTTGVQTQDRHLFLFNDLLLVAKARPGGNFKLKEKVKVSEMWLTDSSCLEDVSEVSCPPAEVSFVMGWPITNVVAAFSSPSVKDLWWTELSRTIGEEMEKEPKATPIQVLYYDSVSSVEYCKTVTVGRRESARTVLRTAAQSLDLPTAVDPNMCQLWVRDEDAPYPLVGHERPLAIRMHALREAGFQSENGQRLDHCNNVYTAGGQFILRNTSGNKSTITATSEAKPNKGIKKVRKSPLRLQKMFRRQKSDVTDSSGNSIATSFSEGSLFNIPLSRLCDNDRLPHPIFALLNQLWLRGPLTHGIFRRSANARLVREVRERLDAGHEEDLTPLQPVVIAAVFKEFLRSLPDPLLSSQLYPLWMEVSELPDELKLGRVTRLCSRLPPANLNLLRHFLCVLYHIASHSSINMMSAANLGVCVGPSLLWAPNSGAHSAPVTPTTPVPTPMLAAASRTVPCLVQFLIEHCPEVMGPSCLHLFGNTGSDRETTSRQDSGAEESDSLHSSNGLRRDDSSIDSLERELMTDGENALPRKDKMSLTNLSRDSGLTMSDSQLYTPDEEEQSEDSSEKSDNRQTYPLPLLPCVYSPVYKRREYGHAKVSPTYSTPTHLKMCSQESQYRDRSSMTSSHTQPINPHFQRQDWFRRKSNLRRGVAVGSSKSQNSNGKTEVMSPYNLCRSASEESLLHRNASECNNKRPALHGKGRAPPPPPVPPMLPSCKRSQSHPHLPEVADRSYDSSTLSDDDSTPHVSRSNSRGKDFVSSISSAPNNSSPNMTYDVQAQHALSARAKQLYQESLRIYQEQSLHAHATPVRVESDESISGGENTRCSTLSRSTKQQTATPHRIPRKHITVMRVSKDEGVQTESRSAGPCERRGRALRRCGWNNSQRSKSLPPMGSDGESDNEMNQQPASYVDPSLRHEISWCVSELRALYDRPPPYRPPPHPHPCLIPAYRAPITNYHLGNSQSELYVTKQLLSGKNSTSRSHSRSDSTDESNCGEESYV